MDLMEKVKQSEFGEIVGISQPAVSDLLSRNVLSCDGNLGRWIFEYCENLRNAAAGRGSAEHANERLALTRAKRIAAEISNSQRCGNLVEAEAAKRAITTWAAMARNAFETIPDKLSPRLAHETEADKCHAMLDGEIEAVLCDLAKGALSIKLSGREADR